MIRRDFMKTALGAGIAASAASSPAGAASVDDGGRKPRIMYYHDARHPLAYMFEPPMPKQAWEIPIDELVGTPVEVLNFGLGDGRTVFHDTKVGEVWGDPIDMWSHAIFRRAHQNVRGLLDDGVDPLRVTCERAREKGMLVYPCLLVNQGQRGNKIDDVRSSNFRFENRHLEIGAKGDLDDFPGATNLDFKHEEVREERFALINEVLTNYPVGGFELQLNYNSPGPFFFHPGEVDAGREIMTAWVARVHRALKASGADRELTIRVPADLGVAYGVGLDVREWIRQGIVDVIVGETYRQYIDCEADFRPIVEAATGSTCRVFGALNSVVVSDRLLSGTIEMIRAAASNYWGQGVDGLYLTEWFAGSNWPYRAPFYEQLREVAHADVMAPKDKFYFVPTQSGYRTAALEKPMPLPAVLGEGETVKLDLRVADDLQRWDAEDRVRKVLLRLRIRLTEIDQIRIRFNGKELPASALKKINNMYMMFAPCRRIFGYWFVYTLDREDWPKQGKNTVEVTLLKKDNVVVQDFTVQDVELETKYQISRNFWVDDDPDIGPYENTGRNVR